MTAQHRAPGRNHRNRHAPKHKAWRWFKPVQRHVDEALGARGWVRG